jgi:hypothetical protein
MRAYDRNWPLISIHVPKCGGSSVRQVLRDWFKPNYHGHYYNEQTSTPPPRHNLRSGYWRRVWLRRPYRAGVCVHGHFNWVRGYGVQDYYPDARQFITVLRDPFEIAISDYFYAKARGDQWFVNGVRAPIAENYAGLPDYFERAILKRKYLIANHMPVEVTLKTFEQVFRDQFIYVGLTEDMPTTMRRLAAKLGFPPVEVPHANESKRDEPVLPGMREAFVEGHPLEFALFEYARAHYQD